MPRALNSGLFKSIKCFAKSRKTSVLLALRRSAVSKEFPKNSPARCDFISKQTSWKDYEACWAAASNREALALLCGYEANGKKT
jgi:hypothetical protein